MQNIVRLLLFLLLLSVSCTVVAEEVVTEVRKLMPSAALAIARTAMEACRKKGYQTAVVVVDRSAQPQVMLRDLYASRFAIEIAERKANAVILSGVSTREFLENRGGIINRMNLVNGILVLEGGLPIVAGGSLVGAVGVSGAPGGDIDASCAQAGIDVVAEQLEFVD